MIGLHDQFNMWYNDRVNTCPEIKIYILLIIRNFHLVLNNGGEK